MGILDYLGSKISPTYPWKVGPQTFHQQCMKEFLSNCGGERGSLGAHLPRVPCGQNQWIGDYKVVGGFERYVCLNNFVTWGNSFQFDLHYFCLQNGLG